MKTLLIVLFFASNCFAQFIPQFNRKPEVGYQINLAHPDAQGLLGYWPLNEALGVTAYDLSAYHRDGPLINMESDNWISGRDGITLDFDGENEYVDLGRTFDIIGEELTLSLWFNTDDISTCGGRMLSKSSGSGESDHFWMINVCNDKLRTRIKAGGSTITVLSDAQTIAAGVWYNVVVVYDGVDVILYQDGIEIARSAKTGTIGTDNTVLVTIGKNGDDVGNEYDGKISNAMVYERAWSPEEVARRFRSQKYALFEQPPGRILAAAAVAARRRPILTF